MNGRKMDTFEQADSSPADFQKLTWKAGNMLYPTPAVMVSCAREGERPDIITIGWTGTVCSDPAMVSISVRPTRYSHDIIEKTGEFVVNLVPDRLVRAADWCGVRSGRDFDKFQEMKLTAGKAAKLKTAPLIAECPVNIECTVTQKIPLGSHDLFLGRVEAVDVDAKYLDEKGKFDLDKAGIIVYSHGEYFGLGKQLGTFGYSVRKQRPSRG